MIDDITVPPPPNNDQIVMSLFKWLQHSWGNQSLPKVLHSYVLPSYDNRQHCVSITDSYGIVSWMTWGQLSLISAYNLGIYEK